MTTGLCIWVSPRPSWMQTWSGTHLRLIGCLPPSLLILHFLLDLRLLDLTHKASPQAQQLRLLHHLLCSVALYNAGPLSQPEISWKSSGGLWGFGILLEVFSKPRLCLIYNGKTFVGNLARSSGGLLEVFWRSSGGLLEVFSKSHLSQLA